MYMNSFNNKNIKELLSNLCCSKCRNDFDIDSVNVKSAEGNIYFAELLCNKCGKNFGDIILNYNRISKTHSALNILDGPEPISIDDVIDAHEFIKKKL